MAQKFYREATQHSDSVLRAGLKDYQDGVSPEAKIRGGTLQSTYISSFTIPSKPQFGGGELKEAELDLYVTGVDYLQGSSKVPEFSVYKFKDASVINEGPNGFFTEAMYGYGKASGSNNQYSDVVKAGLKLDGRNNIIAYSSTLNGMATLDESFNGKGNSFSDGGEYIVAGRTLFQDTLPYTTPKCVDDYAVRAWGESWLGSWAVARDEQYSLAEIRKIYAYPAAELGLAETSGANVKSMVIPVSDNSLHSNSGHTKAVVPKDGEEGVTLYYDDDDWSKSVFDGNRNVIDAQAYGDEVTPSNSMFEIVSTSNQFYVQAVTGTDGSIMRATGDVKFSTANYLSGGQSAEMFCYWDNELRRETVTDADGENVPGSAIEDEAVVFAVGTETEPQNRQEVHLAKKWIPYPMKHPAKTYKLDQDANDFSNVIEIDINVDELEFAMGCGDTSGAPSGTGDARWINLRRAFVVCFGEVEPKSGMTVYDYVKAHSSTAGTQTTVTKTLGTNSEGYTRPTSLKACNNSTATGAKNFAAFALVKTNTGLHIIPSCGHPTIGEYCLGEDHTTAITGSSVKDWIWMLSANGDRDVWIADTNHFLDDNMKLEDISGSWVRLRICITENGGPEFLNPPEKSQLYYSTDTPGTRDKKGHWVGTRHSYGSLMIGSCDNNDLYAFNGQSSHHPPETLLIDGSFGARLNNTAKSTTLGLNNWNVITDSSSYSKPQYIDKSNHLSHMAIFLTNFKETRAGSGNTTTDEFIKAQRPTSSKVYIDSVKFKNFNYAINNASRGREWNKHPDPINISPAAAITGPDLPSKVIKVGYHGDDAAKINAMAQYWEGGANTTPLEIVNDGKLDVFLDIPPTMLSFGFESTTGRYHWAYDGAWQTNESQVDDMPWQRPYTPMMYFGGFTSPNFSDMEEIPTENMLFTYTSAGDLSTRGNISFGTTHSSKGSLMGLGLGADTDATNSGKYVMNISTLPINDHGWHPADKENYMNYHSIPTIALKDFYTGFHLNADVNGANSFVLKSRVHGDGIEDSPEYWMQTVPIRAGDSIKVGDIHSTNQNELTVDTIAHTGTNYFQNDSAANGLTMVTTTNASSSKIYDAIYTQPEGSVRNWSSKGFAQMSVMAGSSTSTAIGSQWSYRENSSASARITDIVSQSGDVVLQVDTVKPLLLNPTDRFIVYKYRSASDVDDYGYLGDSIQPVGDPIGGDGCRNYRLRDVDEITTDGTTYSAVAKGNLKIKSIDSNKNQITLVWDGLASDGQTTLLKYENIPFLMISAYKQWIHGNVACENLEPVKSVTYSSIDFNSSSTSASDYLERVGNDSIASVTMTNVGSSYESTPTVTFSAPKGYDWAVQATGTAIMDVGPGVTVIGVTITNAGKGYPAAGATVTFSGGGGSGAAGTVILTTPVGLSFLDAQWSTGTSTNPMAVAGLMKGDRIKIDDNEASGGATNTGYYTVHWVTPTRIYFGKYFTGWLRTGGNTGACTITKYAPTRALSARSYQSVVDLQNPFVVKGAQLTVPTGGGPAYTAAAITAEAGDLILTTSSSPNWASLVGQYIQIDDEIMFVKALKSGDSQTTVEVYRGQMRTNTFNDGVSAHGEGAAHNIASPVYTLSLHTAGTGEELSALDSSPAVNSGDHTQRILNARNLGCTYHASEINFAADASGMYGALVNPWKPYTLGEDEGSLDIGTDFGFGNYSEDTATGGEVAKQIVAGTGYTELKMPELISGGGIKALDTINFLVTYSDTSSPHEVTINTNNAVENNPLLFAIYEDELPQTPKLRVSPFKPEGYFPHFEWEASDSDLWYGILHIDSTNIYNQYHNKELHIPLNDGGIHKRVPSIVKVNDSTSNVTIGADVKVDRGGLAEYSLRFNGSEHFRLSGYVRANVAGTSNTTFTGSTRINVDPQFLAELDVGDRFLYSSSGSGVASNTEELVVASITDSDTFNSTTSTSVDYISSSTLRLSRNFLSYGTGSADPTVNCTGEMSVSLHITPDSDVGVCRLIGQSDKFEIDMNSSKKIVVTLYWGTSSSDNLELTSSSIIPCDGEIPTSIIVTLDKNLKNGNAKLFINGKLEDQSGMIRTTGTSGSWENNANLATNNNKLYIGSADFWSTSNNLTATSSLESFSYKGLIEEIVIYKSCIYPVVPQDAKFTLTKHLSETMDKGSLSYQARLFIKDYHNIRGTTNDDVAVSPPVSWRKAGFRLCD